jgi:tRNA(Ile2) C34 agmatinyltransferase TiaS
MKIFIGMDDTDVVGSTVGTGHLARMVMAELLSDAIVGYGVSRHQLLFDRRIPYTAKNSSNVIHLYGRREGIDLNALADTVQALMLARFQPGSDPGLCVVADSVPAEVTAFGQRAKREIVTQEEARALANRYSLILRGLGGTNGGIIGALSGVALASSGEDGRFTQVGCSREIKGRVSVEQILAAGVAAVQTVDGRIVEAGEIDCGDKIRPSMRGGQVVLFVEPENGAWKVMRFD